MLVIIILLAIGAGVYWIFSPDIYLFKIAGLKHENAVAVNGELYSFLRNYLPDLLWAFAINKTAILMAEKKIPLTYCFLLITLPFLCEIFQYFHLIKGTFDWYDLLIYLCVFIIYIKPKSFIYAKET